MNNYFTTKKGLIPIVVISLLTVVSILAYFYMYEWFLGYETNQEFKIERKNLERNLEIVKVNGNLVYLQNNVGENLEVSSISIGGKDCALNETQFLSEGLNTVNVGLCTQGFNEADTKDVAVTTQYGIDLESQVLLAVPLAINGSLIVDFKVGICDYASGYIRLYGLSGINNSHAEISSSNRYTYNVCIKDLNYNLGTLSTGNFVNLFYLNADNNSMVWTNKSSVITPQTNWFNVSISTILGPLWDYQISNLDLSSSGYSCVGKVDLDNIYGSHIGDCSSNYNTTLWLKLD